MGASARGTWDRVGQRYLPSSAGVADASTRGLQSQMSEDDGDARASGIRTSGGLLSALARANRAEDVVRVILDRADAAESLAAEVPGEAGRLVRRIVGEAASTAAAQSEMRVSPRGETRAASSARTIRRDVLRPVRTFGGSHGRSAASAVHTQGVGAGNVMKLASRLMGLIHLAENERRRGDV
jgi:hypothetical protein